MADSDMAGDGPSVRDAHLLPPRGERFPGDLVLQPEALLALAVLIANDHWAKHRFSNSLTGKLSDFAGLALFPVIMVSLVEVARRLARRDRWPLERTAMSIAVITTGLFFALAKLWAPGADIYRFTYSTVQWPFTAAQALIRGHTLPGLSDIDLVSDPTDLIALAALIIPLLIGRRVMTSDRAQPERS